MAVRVAVSENGQVRGEEDLMRQCALKLLEGIDSAGELLEGGTTDEFKYRLFNRIHSESP